MPRNVFVGYDIGNHRPKFAYKVGLKGDIETTMQRSAIELLTTDFELNGLSMSADIGQESNAYRCVASPNAEWKDKAWFLDSEGEHEVARDQMGKVKYALPLLVSALWDYLESGDRLWVVASVPRKARDEAKLKASLNGEHVFSFGGVSKKFNIQVLLVVDEGTGLILQEKPQSKQVFLLDIGGGTIIGSAFHRLKQACDPYVLEKSGGRRLISEVANSAQAVQAMGCNEGLSFESAALAVESPGHIIPLKNGYESFAETVRTESEKWLGEVLPMIERKCDHHLHQTDFKLATGGSCKIPAVAKYLEDRGYVIASDPLMGNCKGLLDFAVAAYQKQEQEAKVGATANG